MKKFFTLAAGLVLAAPSLLTQAADDTVFSYATPGEATQAIGWGRLVDNDVAIRLDNPMYVGYEVIGISVDIPVVAGCEVAPVGKAWLTSELFVSPKTYDNVPDIGDPEGVPGEIKNVGTEENPQYRLDITFPEPYVIPEEGVYVGYTLTVTKLNAWTKKYPVSITPSPAPQGGLYMHSSYPASTTTPPIAQHKEWQDLAVSNQAVSTMRVILRGQKPERGGVFSPQPNVYGENGKEKSVNGVFYNYGSEPVSSIGYTMLIVNAGDSDNSSTVNGSLTLPTAVQPEESLEVSLPLTIPVISGDYNVTLTTDLINGQTNLYDKNKADFTIVSRPWIPRKRTLVEEYTGLWCGYCPEAYVTIRQQQDIRPDDFVTLTFHRGDQIQTIASDFQPAPNAGEPAVQFDRGQFSNEYPSFGNMIENCNDMLAPADIDVMIFWKDSEHTALRADATLHFLDAAEADQYRLSFALVEDDMTSPDYKQRNFFWDASQYTSDWYKGKYWDLFVGKPYEVTGIVYDDVTLLFPDCLGIPNSVEAIPADSKMVCTQNFNLADAVGVYNTNMGKNVILDPNKLRVVALLVDTKTGKAMNVNTSGYSGDAPLYDKWVGVDTVSDAEIVAVEYFTLGGIRLAERPVNGAYIVVSHHADGSVSTAKRLQ